MGIFPEPLNLSQYDGHTRKELYTVIAALKAQVAQLTGWKEVADNHYGCIESLEDQLTALQSKSAALVDASQLAADQIRKCDYTPARSTLLVAIAAMSHKESGE